MTVVVLKRKVDGTMLGEGQVKRVLEQVARALDLKRYRVLKGSDQENIVIVSVYGQPPVTVYIA